MTSVSTQPAAGGANIGAGPAAAPAAAPKKPWNPYLIGALIGVLSWASFLFVDKALGTSTTMVHLSGLVTGIVAPDHVIGETANAYYAKEINPEKGKMMFDWQFFLVIGMAVGAFAAAMLFKDRETQPDVPSLWAQRFGSSRALRYAAAFVGGAVLLFGARMAGGCTSGHCISGSLQLAVSSWAFFIAMFASGVATAFALFGKAGRSHVQH